MAPALAAVRIRKPKPAEVDRLVRSAMPLVWDFARKMKGAPLDELVAAGNEGLVRAAHRFSAKHGVKFSTYAAHWIRAMMYKVIERGVDGNPITTRQRRTAFYGLARAHRALGVDATSAEVAKFLGVEEKDVESIKSRLVSLDAVVDHGGDDLVMGLRDDSRRPDRLLEAAQDDHQMHASVARALGCLLPRERNVILKRFLREEPKTLQEIADETGVSRERIRQLQARALKRMHKVLAPKEESP
jgi:RNA polymerase sigma-32 factor